MENLYRKVDEMEFDGLVTGLTPPVQVRGGTICKGAEITTYPRGSVFAKSGKDGKLYLLGTDATSGDTRKKMKVGDSSATYWWLRSAYYVNHFRGVNSDGYDTNSSAPNSYGVALGFCT